jgi:cystathionine beta-synthase
MADEGLLARPLTGDLRDLVTRRFADRAVVSVAPDDTLMVAYARMRLHDVSQLPVIDEGRIVGIVDESDLLLAASGEDGRLAAPVREVMSARLTTVAPETSLRELLPIFDAGLVPIVMDGGMFIGLVTRMDVLGYLRRRNKTS